MGVEKRLLCTLMRVQTEIFCVLRRTTWTTCEKPRWLLLYMVQAFFVVRTELGHILLFLDLAAAHLVCEKPLRAQ